MNYQPLSSEPEKSQNSSFPENHELESPDDGLRDRSMIWEKFCQRKQLWSYFGTIPWRALFEAVLALIALLSLFLLYGSAKPELAPGATAVIQFPTYPVKMEATDYWLEPAMFYNNTILVDKMCRFKELSGDERGVVMIDDWQQYSLPPPQTINTSYIGGPQDKRQSYTIAYYHHIHCIATVAKLFANARMGIGHREDDDEHMVHCLEVLRMAVMCLSDSTFEDGVDYWQNTHQCRDHRQLQLWASERAVWNFTAMIGERVDFL